jgi:hypothetical protein
VKELLPSDAPRHWSRRYVGDREWPGTSAIASPQRPDGHDGQYVPPFTLDFPMKASFAKHALIAVGTLVLSVPPRVFAQVADSHRASDAVRAVSDSLLTQRELAQWAALKKGDTTVFAHLMGGGVVDIDVSGIKRTSPASTARYVVGCQTASYALSGLRIAHVGATAILSYKATVDATCWGQKAPSPLYVLTVYSQDGDSWLPIAHSETPAAHW